MRSTSQSKQSGASEMTDMRKYASGLLRPEDLHGGPRQEKITNVYISEKLNAPILTFASGDEMVAWNNIARVLTRAYGYEDSDWIGHIIELSVGNYTNRDGDIKENIIVRPISTREERDPKPAISKDLDDSIPF
jgi:hypothetical protein